MSKDIKKTAFRKPALKLILNERRNLFTPVYEAIENIDSLSIFNKITVISTLIILSLLTWSYFTPVKEVAITHGQLMPVGKIPVVQHFNGGKISKIYVHDGQHVKRGELLISLEATNSKIELRKLITKEKSLQIDIDRLQSFVKNETINEQELDDELKLLSLQNRSREDQKNILLAQKKQNDNNILKLKSQISTQEQHIKLLDEEMLMYKKLVDKKIVTKQDYLKIKRNINKAQGEFDQLQNQLHNAKYKLLETTSKIHELDSDLNKTAFEKIDKMNSELTQVQNSIKQHQQILKQSSITAPVNGIVKGLNVTIGGIISPGQPIMEIIPDDRHLYVETKINTKDIGHIKIGDRVKIKVATYDFSTYGVIKGKVKSLSASTFLDEQNRPYYKGIITMDKQYLTKQQKNYPLIPGMTVEADIATGEKSIMQYLLKPINKVADISFTER